jgi:hypothetical protein
MPVPPARVAWYVTGRFYGSDDGQLEDLGYFLHLSQVDGALFTGTPGEATAVLTFRSAPFTASPLVNGNLSLGLDATGEFGIYLQPEAGASFDDPASFSRGTRVARFRRISIVMGETLAAPYAGGLAVGMNVFSADLVESTPFELGGRRYDFRDIVPHGVTQWGTMNADPLPAVPPYSKVLAFAGSAIAAG